MIMTFQQLVEHARKRVGEFDEEDRKNGMATPLDRGPVAVLECVMSAMEACYESRSATPLADSYVMLEELRNQLQKPPEKP